MIMAKYPELKALILDMDGVLWRDTEPIGNLPSIFKRIDDLGLKFVLATNNGSKTITEFLDKLTGFGLILAPQQIVTSAMATGSYLTRRFPQKGQVYVVGSTGLKSTLAGYGFIHDELITAQSGLAVVIGLDLEVNYEKLAKASSLVRAGLALIGTNPDITYPTPQGLLPGAGTIIRAVETASEVDAIIIGKPKPELFIKALEVLGTLPHETLVVGDRLETDIAAAQATGCLSALVLSGASTLEQAQNWYPQPDIIVKDLAELIR